MPYEKIDRSLVDSKIWLLPPEYAKILIYLILVSDRNGRIYQSIPVIAYRNALPIETTREVLKAFSEPDPDSRSKAYEGRVIEFMEEDGIQFIQLLNYQRFRDKDTTAATRMRRYRLKIKQQEDVTDTAYALRRNEDALRRNERALRRNARNARNERNAEHHDHHVNQNNQETDQETHGFDDHHVEHQTPENIDSKGMSDSVTVRYGALRRNERNVTYEDEDVDEYLYREEERGKNSLPRQVIGLFNETLGHVLPRVQKLTPRRRSKIATQTKNLLPTLEHWKLLFQAVLRSPFLLGDNKRGWRATFDWLLSAENATKVLEGVYEPRAKVRAPICGECGKELPPNAKIHLCDQCKERFQNDLKME
ncbi:MAG: hypothetical protein QXW98_04940 [Candidatus Caldarchaeum sp.]